MALVSELELPELDYTDPSMRGERFHEAMRELRAQGWLASGPYGYVVLDREAGEHFLRARDAIFPGMTIADIFGVREGPLYEQMKRNILHVNGPDHTRLRSLVNPALSPRAVERYRPAMRGFLQTLLGQVRASSARGGGSSQPGTESSSNGAGYGRPGAPGGSPADVASPGSPESGVGGSIAESTRAEREAGRDRTRVRCEFVEQFAKPYPSQTIALVMGAPIEDAPKLHHWSNWIQRQFDAASMATERGGIERAVNEFYDYAGALVEARRKDPREDLISRLIAAEEQGNKLDDVECINLVLNVLAGGVDTTQSQLAHAIRLLAEHPRQWRLLQERPELAHAAVEEALRYEPITPFTARITTAEMTYRDVVFPAGTVVMVCAFTGNRDLPADQREPDRFDIAAAERREPSAAARVLTFGAGVHYCVGANLARAELQEGLRFLAEHLNELELDGYPEYETITGIYGLARLPISFLS
jgi:cytochrome P450